LKREKIIVIEDDPDILEVISYNLSREGYSVITARDGEEGLKKIREQAPSLVILDLMLPVLDGLEVCKRLKGDPFTKDIPIIMVTAKGEESDIVLGLGLGADDYVPKPFSVKELLARVSAVLRRGPLREDVTVEGRIVRGGVVIDSTKHEVTIDKVEVPFTATEFRLLFFLASHPGRVFGREELITRVIGEDAAILDRNIDVHVKSIRKKLGKYRDFIETVRGVGYRFSG